VNRRSPQRKKMKIARSAKKSSQSAQANGTVTKIKEKVNSVLILLLIVVNVILIAHLVQRFIVDYSPTISAIDLVNQKRIQVRVLNGCGISGLANSFAEFLKRNDYDVVETGNAETYDYPTTLLIDHNTREQKEIEKLCRTLDISTNLIIRLTTADAAADATIIIGSDYESLHSYRAMN